VSQLATVDTIAAAVLGLAALRGLWIGAVREAFSLAGLGLAWWVVRTWRLPAAAWLLAHGPFEMTDLAARVLATLGLGAGTLVVVAVVSRLVYRGLHEAGLGVVDRGLGMLLGAFEGALVMAALMFGLVALLGREDAALAGTRSLAAYEWVESALGVEPAAVRPDRPNSRARG
jgi:uncharacterized membrane protein required for colicin V production